MMSKFIPYVLVVCIIGASSLASLIALQPFQNWGGDFAYYLNLARNLADAQTIDAQGIPQVTALGFPWLLSFLDIHPGQEIRYKLVNILLLAGSMLMLFDGARLLFGKASALVVLVLCALLFEHAYFANAVLTECLAFSLACLVFWLTSRFRSTNPFGFLVLLIALIFACWVRQFFWFCLFGLALFHASASLVSIRTHWQANNKRAPLTHGGMAITTTLLCVYVFNANWFVVQSGTSLIDLNAVPSIIAQKFMVEVSHLAKLFVWTTAFPIGLAAAAFAIWGLVEIARRGNSVGALVLMFYGVPMWLLPFVAGSGRYVYPIVFLCFLGVVGFGRSVILFVGRYGRLWSLGFGTCLTIAACLYSLTQAAQFNLHMRKSESHSPSSENARMLWQAISQQVPSGEPVCFFKPRILVWYSRNMGVSANYCLLEQQTPPEEIIEHVRVFNGAKWTIIAKAQDGHQPGILNQARRGDFGDVTFENSEFVLVYVGD